jgi:hypothetical protein
MTGSTSSPLRLLVALATGVMIVLFTMILLPFLFVFWITYWLPHELDALSRAAVPSPTEAVQCDGGKEDSTPLVDAIMRDNFIADLERRLENRVLDEAPLPPAFQRWMDGRQNK